MIKWWIEKGKEHLKINDTTYFKHLIFACKMGTLSICAGIVLIIHGIFPYCFENTGSNFIRFLAKIFENRHRIDDT